MYKIPKATPALWNPFGTNKVTCTYRNGEQMIVAPAKFREAQRMVRAWLSPLFRRVGPTFEVFGVAGYRMTLTPAMLAKMFEVEIKTRRPSKPLTALGVAA